MRVIIVGGGFAGINLALSLAHNIKFEVTLVDKNSYNFYPPFLYQVAASIFEPSQISNPFLKLFSGKDNLTFHRGEMESVIPDENKIVLSDGILEYDYLVLATGTVTNFFGNKNIQKHAFSLKTIEDAVLIQKRLLLQAENAFRAKDPVVAKAQLTFVIAGGGPSGVEVAAMLSGIRNNSLKKTYPHLRAEIYLIEKNKNLLSAMTEKSQTDAWQYLRESGVKVILGAFVEDFSNANVLLSTDEVIKSENLIWMAGTEGRIIPGLAPEVYGKDNRILVDRFNKVKNTYNIFAIGDISLEMDRVEYPDGHPQVAQVAIQQGENLARNFQLMAEQQELGNFVYKNPGFSVVMGNMKAVTDLKRFSLNLKGILAWFVLVFLHWMPMTAHGSRLKMIYAGIQSSVLKKQSFRRL